MATDHEPLDLTEIVHSPEQQARDWWQLLESDQATAADRQRFERWQTLDTAHQQAFTELQTLHTQVAAMADLQALETPNSSENPETNFWSNLGQQLSAWFNPTYAVDVASVAAIAVIGLPYLTEQQQPASVVYQTAQAEDKEIFLPDGSVINLSAFSRIEIQLTEQQRHIYLTSGEAFFDVSKDPKRPFVVDTEDSRITVLGTHFNVNASSGFSQVSVEEGRVEVANQQLDQRQILGAGQRIQMLDSGDLSPIASIEPSAAGAWRKGLRIYFETSLHDVLLDLNRYSEQPITLGEQGLNDLTVTAIFPASDVDLMLQALDNTLPLRLEKQSEAIVLYAD